MVAALLLDLEPDCVTTPTRPDLSRIEAMMLWPDDAAMRQKAIRSANMRAYRDLLRQGLLPAELLPAFTDLAVDATPLDVMQEAAKARFVEGFVTGHCILSAIALRDIAPDKAAIGRSVKAAAKGLWPEWRLSPKTINNRVLPTFRPVAHLWAAFVSNCFEGDNTFPCRAAGLPAFLAMAESLRRLGEKTKLPRSPVTVLRPGEAVQIPDDVLHLLPQVAVKFARKVEH